MTTVASTLAVAILEVTLGAIVVLRNPRLAANRWFAAFTCGLAGWTTLVGLGSLVTNPALDVVRSRGTFAVVALVPVALLRFSATFPIPGGCPRWLVRVGTGIGVFVSGLAFSPWIVASTRLTDVGTQPVYGPLHRVFALYFLSCVVAAVVVLVRKRRHARGLARVQLQYLFLGIVLTAAGAATTNLILPILWKTSRFSRQGPYFVLILLVLVGHSIVRHRLMDIRIVLSRSVAYALAWMLTMGSLVAVASRLGVHVFADDDLSLHLDLLLGLASAAGFVFLAPRIKRLADRYLYRPAYDARRLIREGSRAMSIFGKPRQVAEAMGALIHEAFHPESLALVVRDRDAYRPLLAQHLDPAHRWPVGPLPATAPLLRQLADTVRALLPGDPGFPQTEPAAEAIQRDLVAWNAEVAVPVRDGDLLGLILLGPKRSGDPYFGEDLDLLETLGSELAIGLRNAQLYHEVGAIKDYNERLLDRMYSGVVAVDDDGIVTTFNPSAERITGLSAEDVVGRPLTSLDEALQAVLRDSLVGHKDDEVEIAVTQPDGWVLPLVVRGSALQDPSGQIRGAIVVLNDLSRLKALEEDKRRADRLAATAPLVTGIAHEIRNPLVAIKTFAELLPERADDPEFRSTFTRVAVKEIHRIEQLLGRLRALAVPLAARLRPLDVASPLSETGDLLRGEADRRQVRLALELEPDLPPVLGDADQLKQLFLNLLLNGLEAMAAGGLLGVSARTSRGPSDEEQVTVWVTDTGPGAPPEERDRIFEPFFTTKPSGTGLGLTICRTIADAHRAALWAEPGPGGLGTTFVVQFPTAEASGVAEARR